MNAVVYTHRATRGWHPEFGSLSKATRTHSRSWGCIGECTRGSHNAFHGPDAPVPRIRTSACARSRQTAEQVRASPVGQVPVAIVSATALRRHQARLSPDTIVSHSAGTGAPGLTDVDVERIFSRWLTGCSRPIQPHTSRATSHNTADVVWAPRAAPSVEPDPPDQGSRIRSPQR